MSGLLLCGKTSDRPLHISEAKINLYSMEELCYYLYNNIYVIGPEFFDNSLLEFIENGLGLENVAKKLKDQMYRNESYIGMIRTILEGSYYYSSDEKESIMELLKELENKSVHERMKARGDLLAEKGRYEAALRIYKMLLEKKYKNVDSSFIGCIWNNMGVIYAKLFLYEDAFNCFKLACDMDMEQEYLDNLICISLIINDEQKIGDIKLQYQVTDEILDRYNRAIELAEENIKTDGKLDEIREKLTYSPDKELGSFYNGADEIITMWKKAYREQIQ